MTPLFSIIIPVYNVEPYLQKCLDSVVNQTCPDWECICVDDGSPDNCGSILDEYAARDTRIQVIHQANAGVSVARNTALDKAQGQWLQFLDSDDSLKLDFLEKLQEAVNEHSDVDAVEHTEIYCYNDGKQVYGGGRLPPKCVVDAQEILSDPFGKKYTSLGRCSCFKIFRRSVIEKANLRFTPEIPINEDSLFAAQFYAFAGKIAICPEIAGYLRIIREGSALQNITPEKLIPRIHGAEILYATLQKRPTPGLRIRFLAEIIGLAYLGTDQGEKVGDACREAVLASSFFCMTCLMFMFLHGTRKMRMFAAIMLVSPKALKRRILKWMNRKAGE